MFNLDESIKDWRNDLNKNDVLSLDDLEELESHLMDEITVLKEKDLSEEEAFLVAKRRIGQNDIIEEEYKKVNHNKIWTNKLFYLFFGYICYHLILSLTNMISAFIIILFSISTPKYAYSHSLSKLSFILHLFIFISLILFIYSNKLTNMMNHFSNIKKSKKIFNIIIIISLIISIDIFSLPFISACLGVQSYGEIAIGSTLFSYLTIPIFFITYFIINKVKNHSLAKA